MTTTFTINYHFRKSAFDMRTWHDDLNDNWDDLDGILLGFLSLGNFVTFWAQATNYEIGIRVYDAVTPAVWQCAVAHTSTPSGTFLNDRTDHPTYWSAVGVITTATATNITYTPSGTLAATNVQTALDELLTEDILKVQVYS